MHRNFVFGAVILLWFCHVVQGSSNSRGPEEDSSASEEEEKCHILPPIPKRSEVAGEVGINIVDLLNGGVAEMMSLSGNLFPRDVNLLLGNTGVGKSVVAQVLTTDMKRLHAVLTDGGKMVIVDDDERIGAPTTISRTLIPELVSLNYTTLVEESEINEDSTIINENSTDVNVTIANETFAIVDSIDNTGNSSRMRVDTTYFYDCPGFSDTRGPLHDMAANFFINQIIREVARVKLLFLVPTFAVQPGMSRTEFDSLATHAIQFVRNLGHFENSIGLIVTKVNSFDSRRKYIKDKRIVKSIVEFLSSYNATLYSQLETNLGGTTKDILKKAEFVRILLTRDSEGNYERISFSRSPDVCGPLSNSETVASSKQQMTELYQRLNYTSVGAPENFGYTVRPETIQSVQNYTRDVNKAIGNMVTETMLNFTDWFDRNKVYESSQVGEISKSLQRDCSEINNFLKNLPSAPSKFFANLSSTLEKIGYPFLSQQHFQKLMNDQENYLDFFDKVTETQVDRLLNEWSAPVLTVLTILEKYREWYGFLAELQNRMSTYDIQLIPPDSLLQNTTTPQEIEWLEWIEQHKILLVGDHHKLIYNNLDDRHKIILGEIMKTVIVEKYVQDVNQLITKKIQDVMTNFTVWFDREAFQNSDQVESLSKSVGRYESNVAGLLANLSSSPPEFARALKLTLKKIGYRSIPPQFETVMTGQVAYFNFFDKVTGIAVNRTVSQWTAPILHFQLDTLKRYKDWYSFLVKVNTTLDTFDIHSIGPASLQKSSQIDWIDWIEKNGVVFIGTKVKNAHDRMHSRDRALLGSIVKRVIKEKYVKDVNTVITQNIEGAMSNFTEWFEGEKFREKNQYSSISSSMQIYSLAVNNFLKSLPSAPSQFAASLVSTLATTGYTVPQQFQNFMKDQEEYLNFFDRATGTLVDRPVSEWSASIQTFKDKLENYREWYSFLAEVNNRLVKYDIQLISSYSLEQVATGQVDWLNWIEQHNIHMLGDHLRTVYANLPESHKGNVLVDILKAAVELKYVSDVNKLVAEKVQEVMRLFDAWFRGEIFSKDIYTTDIGSIIEKCRNAIESLERTKPSSPSAFVTSLKSTLGKSGYTLPNGTLTLLEKQSHYFTVFDRISGSRVGRAVGDWLSPISVFKSRLDEHKNWHLLAMQTTTTTEKPFSKGSCDGTNSKDGSWRKIVIEIHNYRENVLVRENYFVDIGVTYLSPPEEIQPRTCRIMRFQKTRGTFTGAEGIVSYKITSDEYLTILFAVPWYNPSRFGLVIDSSKPSINKETYDALVVRSRTYGNGPYMKFGFGKDGVLSIEKANRYSVSATMTGVWNAVLTVTVK